MGTWILPHLVWQNWTYRQESKSNGISKSNKKAFFLRHTACLPSSTSQLVWSGPCLGGPLPTWVCSSTTTSGVGGLLPLPLWGGNLFHHHFWGVPFHYHFWGGSSSTTTSRGDPLPLPIPGGVLFHHHFQGAPCDLSHNALIYCYRMPQCIMGKIHMGVPLRV